MCGPPPGERAGPLALLDPLRLARGLRATRIRGGCRSARRASASGPLRWDALRRRPPRCTCMPHPRGVRCGSASVRLSGRGGMLPLARRLALVRASFGQVGARRGAVHRPAELPARQRVRETRGNRPLRSDLPGRLGLRGGRVRARTRRDGGYALPDVLERVRSARARPHLPHGAPLHAHGHRRPTGGRLQRPHRSGIGRGGVRGLRRVRRGACLHQRLLPSPLRPGCPGLPGRARLHAADLPRDGFRLVRSVRVSAAGSDHSGAK